MMKKSDSVKRLIISGFGCPKEPWISFLDQGTEVITLHDVLEDTQSSQMDDWANYVAGEILRISPDSIVVHDFGGTMTLKALIQLQDRNIRLTSRLTLLNTAFRDFDVLKNPHPLLMQVSPWGLVSRLIVAAGGEVDPELKPWWSTIRQIYRQVIIGSFARKIQLQLYSRRKARSDSLDIDLGIPAQIIASSNDPFISIRSLYSIQEDFLIPNFHTVDYGHFPYSSRNREKVRQLIHHFEGRKRAIHAKEV